MRFRGDDRAVTVQIGAVLLLGFLVISLSLYQATVVPDENRQVEFQHNQRVQADILEVGNAILGTAATGSAAPATVELGTQYPTRTVAVNPSPPSGTLSTSSLGNISINNATADDAATAGEDYPETADFWNGTTHNYTTKSLEYRPSYANYDNAPTTVYENGIVYNRFRSGNNTRSEQPVVAGTRISLVALDGELARGGVGSLQVDPQAVSVSTRTISVTNNSTGENVSVVVPSELDAQEWTDLLNETGDYDPAAGPDNGAHVYEVENVDRGVELYFEPGVTYQLKLSKVGVGSNVGSTEPAYLTSVGDLEANPFVNRTYPFVVESRDKYNNPIATQVDANVPPGTVIEPGRYRYQYEALSTGQDWVNVTYLQDSGITVYQTGNADFDGELRENVQYDVNVQASSGGSGGGSGNSAQIVFVGDTIEGKNNGEFSFRIENTGSTGVRVTRFTVGGSLAEELEAPGGGNDEFILNNAEASDGPYDVDGTFNDVTLTDTNPTLQAGGGTGDIRLNRLLDSEGNQIDTRNLQYAPDSSPTEADLYITLEFEDGSQKTFYFE